MKSVVSEKGLLADAVAELIESLHHKYPGISTKPIPPIEDEDYALEIVVPTSFSTEEVEIECQRECIKAVLTERIYPRQKNSGTTYEREER